MSGRDRDSAPPATGSERQLTHDRTESHEASKPAWVENARD